MYRVLISLNDEDKTWLQEEAEIEKISMASVVRHAIVEYRKKKIKVKKKLSFEQLLEATKGTWHHGDGLKYQSALREEWK